MKARTLSGYPHCDDTSVSTTGVKVHLPWMHVLPHSRPYFCTYWLHLVREARESRVSAHEGARGGGGGATGDRRGGGGGSAAALAALAAGAAS